MTKPNDGGPAFPCCDSIHEVHGLRRWRHELAGLVGWSGVASSNYGRS